MTDPANSTLPALVMLPGTLCDRFLFAGQVDALDTEIQVGDLTRSNTMEGLAQDVLRDAPAKFALLGHSMGAIVAAEVVRMAPERVVGLALLDTNLGPSSQELDDRRVGWVTDARDGDFPTVVVEHLVFPLTGDLVIHGKEVFEMALRVGQDAFVRQTEAILGRIDRRPILDDLDIPVLVVCGAQDAVTPVPLHRELAERCINAKLVIVPDAGHLSTIDQPEALTRSIDRWLRSCGENA